MRRTSLGAAHICIAVCVTSAGAQQLAENPLLRDCAPAQVLGALPALYGPVWQAAHPANLASAAQPDMANGLYAKAIAKAASLFDSLLIAAAPAASVQSLHGGDETMRGQFNATIAELSQKGTVNTKRFTVVTRVADPRTITLFPGTSQILFTETAADSALHRAFCWPALAADLILSAYATGSRRAIASRLDTLDAHWNMYRASSYSQFPWEMLVNGFKLNRSLEPPSFQFILLHPSPAVEITNIGDRFSPRDASKLDVVALEWIGFVARTGADWQHSAGLSVVSGFASAGSDIGLLLHVSPTIEIGFVRRPRLDDGRRPFAFIATADVFRLFDSFRGPLNRTP